MIKEVLLDVRVTSREPIEAVFQIFWYSVMDHYIFNVRSNGIHHLLNARIESNAKYFL